MDWLVGHFTVLGLEIQNWNLVMGFIFALWILYIIIAMERFARSNSKNIKK
jgi:hypothetical protein